MQDRHDSMQASVTIRQNDVSPPVAIPPGHVGPVMLPGTGRQIWSRASGTRASAASVKVPAGPR